jgi:hypothetical protein
MRALLFVTPALSARWRERSLPPLLANWAVGWWVAVAAAAAATGWDGWNFCSGAETWP